MAIQFTIPNDAEAATYPKQAEPDGRDFEIIAQGLAGYCVMSGCAVAAQGSPNMTVAVTSGQVMMNGVLTTVTGANVTIAAADASNPRFDLIAADNTGTPVRIAGTAAANPVFPTIPANRVILAAVYVPATDTAIENAQIIDKRMLNKFAPFDVPVKLADWGLPGDLATQTGTLREYVPFNATITGVYASCGTTAPTGNSVKVDVNKNGTTIFSTQANRPTIAVSTQYAAGGTPDVPDITAGDYLTRDIDQIGSTLPGAGLVVTVWGKIR